MPVTRCKLLIMQSLHNRYVHENRKITNFVIWSHRFEAVLVDAERSYFRVQSRCGNAQFGGRAGGPRYPALGFGERGLDGLLLLGRGHSEERPQSLVRFV